MIVEALQKLASHLRPLMPLSVAVGVAGCALFTWSAVTQQGDGYLAPGLLAAVWGAWLFTLISGFNDTPPQARRQQSWRTRLEVRLARTGYTVMAWIILVSGLVALFMTYRLLALWVG
jgi:hypothetical protein